MLAYIDELCFNGLRMLAVARVSRSRLGRRFLLLFPAMWLVIVVVFLVIESREGHADSYVYDVPRDVKEQFVDISDKVAASTEDAVIDDNEVLKLASFDEGLGAGDNVDFFSHNSDSLEWQEGLENDENGNDALQFITDYRAKKREEDYRQPQRDIGEDLAEQDPDVNTDHTHSVGVSWPHVPFNTSYGEGGVPVLIDQTALSEADRQRYDEGLDAHGFNQYVSDLVSVTRGLPEFRDAECLELDYDLPRLPSTSVIIIFRNEAWTTLVRTIHSVLNGSPPELLHEIVLVDDDSEAHRFGHLKAPLEAYIAQLPRVHLYRTPERYGLIRARLLGAEKATGTTLTFLDSHCEVFKDWLEPLMSRIAEDPHHVVMPIIDVIDWNTLELKSTGSGHDPQIGGFLWDMNFSWEWMTPKVKAQRNSCTDPIRSATMAGGLFSVDREYFYQIGSYDTGMNIWGAENLEMSFRIWMCGGSIELIPCSRVGHIFRAKNPNVVDVGHIIRNTMRLVEVWLDEYKALYYLMTRHVPNPERFGDLSARRELRENLQCQSFQWYLENIYPKIFDPIRDNSGTLQYMDSRYENRTLCLGVSSGIKVQEHDAPSAIQCTKPSEQLYMNKMLELRTASLCLSFDQVTNTLSFVKCDGVQLARFWQMKDNTITHVDSGLCLTVTSEGLPPTMQLCDNDVQEQRWYWR